MKKILLTAFIAVAFANASDKEYKMLETHASECLDYLEAFLAEDYNPENIIKASYKNSNVTLQYDEAAVASTDGIAQKWINDCKDLFDKEKFGPKFFKDSPVKKVIEDKIKKHRDAVLSQNPTEQTSKADSIRKAKSYTISALFNYGVLEKLEVFPPYHKRFQYNYQGQIVARDVFENGTSILPWQSNTFSFTFKKDDSDSIKYYSPYKIYRSEWIQNGLMGTKKEIAEPRTWVINNASQDLANGQFTFEQDKFAIMPKSINGKSWAPKLNATIGMGISYLTDDMYKDNYWDKDSTENPLSIHIDFSLGAVHCLNSGHCFGFGSGYERNIFTGTSTPQSRAAKNGTDNSDYYYYYYSSQNKSKSEILYLDNIKVYGEYYFKTETPTSIRQSIGIPIKKDLKYTTFKTSIAFDTSCRFELGIFVSPIQYIPGFYMAIGL